MEGEEADEDEERQHRQRIGDGLGMWNGAGDGARHAPTLDGEQAQEPREGRGDIDAHARHHQRDKQQDAADADPRVVDAERHALGASASWISSAARSSAPFTDGAATGAKSGFTARRR